MNILRNKKGDNRFMFFWFVFFVGAVVVVIIWGNAVLFGKSIDVREEEAKILAEKIFITIYENVSFNDSLYLMKAANLDKKIIEKFYYFNVSLDYGAYKEEYFYGNHDFEVYCFLNGDLHPRCYNKEINIKLNGKDVKLKILTGSNQRGDLV